MVPTAPVCFVVVIRGLALVLPGGRLAAFGVLQCFSTHYTHDSHDMGNRLANWPYC